MQVQRQDIETELGNDVIGITSRVAARWGFVGVFGVIAYLQMVPPFAGIGAV